MAIVRNRLALFFYDVEDAFNFNHLGVEQGWSSQYNGVAGRGWSDVVIEVVDGVVLSGLGFAGAGK